jgi:hypothetical protein
MVGIIGMENSKVVHRAKDMKQSWVPLRNCEGITTLFSNVSMMYSF